jgi:hypothetical protein
MVESVTASLTAGVVLVVLVAMAITRAVRRRLGARKPEPLSKTEVKRDETRLRRAS